MCTKRVFVKDIVINQRGFEKKFPAGTEFTTTQSDSSDRMLVKIGQAHEEWIHENWVLSNSEVVDD